MEQLFIHDLGATTYEYKDDSPHDDNDDCLRVFRNAPGFISVQVRATSRLSLFSRGKVRRFYSTITLNKDEVRTLINALRREIKNL